MSLSALGMNPICAVFPLFLTQRNKISFIQRSFYTTAEIEVCRTLAVDSVSRVNRKLMRFSRVKSGVQHRVAYLNAKFFAGTAVQFKHRVFRRARADERL